MQYILEGILFGLTLTILLGPLFIILIQSSIQGGSRAGILAASGIWTSDILIVTLSILFVKKITPYVNDEGFVFWVGLIGGLVLIGVGIVTLFRKAELAFDGSTPKRKGAVGHWLTGFMVNTINPFTIIFWLSTITAFVAQRKLNTSESFLFAGSIIITIMITDTLKVLFAKLIRTKIDVRHLTLINRIAGSALVVFGIALLVRSVFQT